jgi:acyl carrier protein
MNDTELKGILIELLRQIAPDTEPADLKPTDHIRDNLNIDSFDFLQFIVALDEKIGIEIPEAEYSNVTTLQDMMGYIQNAMAER